MSISDKDWSLIANRLVFSECIKGQELTSLGSIEKKLYFLLDGAVRLYYELENKDVTLNIGFPNSFISSYTSYLTRTPSDFILEALTPMHLSGDLL